MKIKKVRCDSLVYDPTNARKRTPRNLATIRASLEKFGQRLPLIVRGNVVRTGNGRLRIMRELAWDHCFVTLADDLSDADATALALVDNRSAELAEWDDAQLAESLKKIGEHGTGVADLGWNGDEFVAFMATINAGEPEQDEAPELPKKATTKAGDVWTMGKHRLLCGDVTRGIKIIRPRGGFDLMLSDPPYCSGGFQEAGKRAGSVGTRGDELVHNDQLSTRGYQALMRSSVAEVNPKAAYVFVDWRMWVNLFDIVEASGLGVRSMIVWNKGSAGMGQGWRNQHELIMFGSRSALKFVPKLSQGNVIDCARTGNELHATEKPVDLIAALLAVTSMARTVCDPFAGSGTTLIACDQLDRVCYAVELDPRYCDVIVQRWQNETGGKAKLTRGAKR